MQIASRLEWLARKVIIWAGKDYLIPFMDGLIHLGRPAPIAFPYELLEQGLAIALSGLNNTMAIQSNPDWVWPYWVERQIQPDSEEFMPTAINLIKTNLTGRNWTSLGLPDSPRESMVDPVGMLTLSPYGWSIFPFLRVTDKVANKVSHKVFSPPEMHGLVKQKLLDGFWPCVITEYQSIPGLIWRSEASALSLEGEELMHFGHYLENQSDKNIELCFGLALRPYNPLTIGHINKIQYKNRLWRINHKPGLLLLSDPDKIILSDRHQGDPLRHDLTAFSGKYLRSRSGISTGLAEFTVKLAPSEKWELQTLGTLSRLSISPLSKFKNINLQNLLLACDKQKSQWIEQSLQGLQINIPDPQLTEAFHAVKNHLHVFDDGKYFTPGTFLYHHHWFRDSAFIALAFENMSLGQKVKSKAPNYLAQQDKDGFFKSQKGEWDSNGQAIFTLVRHVRMGGDLDILDKIYPALIKGLHWIEKMRGPSLKSPSPHFGLLPAGFSAEHFGPNDHYYWDNFWSLAAFQETLWAAQKLNKKKDLAWISDTLETYRLDILHSMQSAFNKVGKETLPSSPYRWMDSSAIGGLVAISPLDIFSPHEPWVKNTIEYLWQNNMRDGLFFQKIVHTGLNPYLSIQLARAMMRVQDPRWFSIMQALQARATKTYTWPEALHPRVYGGCMGDGDHGWSAAEFLSLTREMLVTEQMGELLLAPNVPTEWFIPGLQLEIKQASTLYGTVTYKLHQHQTSLQLNWNIDRRQHQDSAPLYLLLPQSLPYQMGPTNKIGSQRVKIPLLENKGHLTFFSLPHAESWHETLAPQPFNTIPLTQDNL